MRRMISTKSAGRGRVVTVYYNPLCLRHEIECHGRKVEIFCGSVQYSRKEAISRASSILAEMRAGKL